VGAILIKCLGVPHTEPRLAAVHVTYLYADNGPADLTALLQERIIDLLDAYLVPPFNHSFFQRIFFPFPSFISPFLPRLFLQTSLRHT
jgi:hypothetical protein